MKKKNIYIYIFVYLYVRLCRTFSRVNMIYLFPSRFGVARDTWERIIGSEISTRILLLFLWRFQWAYEWKMWAQQWKHAEFVCVCGCCAVLCVYMRALMMNAKHNFGSLSLLSCSATATANTFRHENSFCINIHKLIRTDNTPSKWFFRRRRGMRKNTAEKKKERGEKKTKENTRAQWLGVYYA